MSSLETGKRLADRYVLQERLGDGGHAEVWAAFDEQQARRVALKFLHAQICDADDAWLVLQHEAQMAQRLDHPGVLQLETPQREGQTVFLPMQYASGGDATALRGAAWPRVLPVLIEVAKILEHAHSRGVVHRDIKPGNALFGESGAVLLTDFGAAARTGSTAALSTGSPFSASPQQLRGEAATTADDVYGLGALAYELLSQHPPYYPDFDARHAQHEIPAQLRPLHVAPAALVAFIMSMLARDATDRPDLRQVMQVFDQYLVGAEPASGFAGALVIESLQPQEAKSANHGLRHFHMTPALWLSVAAGVAVAVFLLLLPAIWGPS
jgi:serine/threonine-protein kinase